MDRAFSFPISDETKSILEMVCYMLKEKVDLINMDDHTLTWKYCSGVRRGYLESINFIEKLIEDLGEKEEDQ